ncbi:MAG: tetratricopeptide (TPR) repeat protein [Arenicella sp.]|jgi:tetratricopeptide (TPR) repeat protein
MLALSKSKHRPRGSYHEKILTLIAIITVSFAATANAQDQNEQAIFATATTKFLVLSSQEKCLEAKPFVQQAYELGQKIYADSDPLFGPIAYHYGAVQIALRDPSSLEPLTQAKNNYQQHLGEDSLQLIAVFSDLASAHILAGNFDSAEEYVDQAVKLASKEYGDDSTMVANLSSRAGNKCSQAGNYALALKLQDQAHEIYQGVLGPTRTAREVYQLSESFRLNKNLYGQVTFFKKTIDTFKLPSVAETDFERTVHTKLIEAYQCLEKPKRATKLVLALASSSVYQDRAEPTLLVKANATYLGRGDNTKFEGVCITKIRCRL